jgi:hypothetical protein
MAKKPPTTEALAKMKEVLDAAELDFDNAKLAYFHRAQYKGQEVTYEVLKGFAEAYIARNHEYQKAVFGKVRIRLLAAKLMRE